MMIHTGYLQFYVLIIFGHHLIAENSDRKTGTFFSCLYKKFTRAPRDNQPKSEFTIGAEYWGHNKQRTSGSVLLFDFNLFGSRDRWGFGFSIPTRVF